MVVLHWQQEWHRCQCCSAAHRAQKRPGVMIYDWLHQHSNYFRHQHTVTKQLLSCQWQRDGTGSAWDWAGLGHGDFKLALRLWRWRSQSDSDWIQCFVYQYKVWGQEFWCISCDSDLDIRLGPEQCGEHSEIARKILQAKNQFKLARLGYDDSPFFR